MLQREAELPGVERHRASHILHLVAHAVHAVDERARVSSGGAGRHGDPRFKVERLKEACSINLKRAGSVPSVRTRPAASQSPAPIEGRASDGCADTSMTSTAIP